MKRRGATKTMVNGPFTGDLSCRSCHCKTHATEQLRLLSLVQVLALAACNASGFGALHIVTDLGLTAPKLEFTVHAIVLLILEACVTCRDDIRGCLGL